MKHDSLAAGFLEEGFIFIVVGDVECDVGEVSESFVGDFVGVFGLDCEVLLEESLQGNGQLGQDRLEFGDCEL